MFLGGAPPAGRKRKAEPAEGAASKKQKPGEGAEWSSGEVDKIVRMIKGHPGKHITQLVAMYRRDIREWNLEALPNRSASELDEKFRQEKKQIRDMESDGGSG